MSGWECAARFARKFQKKISALFSPAKLDETAREVRFKVRKSKLTPIMFVDTILFKEVDNGTVSLNDHSIALKLNHGIDINKQSIDERFNESAVALTNELLKSQLANQINSVVEKERINEVLQHFSAVKIKDSTRFQIPESLKDCYPGSTGAATGAGVHIQFEFDLLNGAVHDLNVTDALRQDQIDAQQTKESVKESELVVRDLGYVSMEVLEHIADKGAYFINRVPPKAHIYDAKNGRHLTFDAIHKEMLRRKLDHLEISVLVSDRKFPTRLILEMLPVDQVNKRMMKAGKECKKKGRKLTKEFKSRAKLNAFITNVPVEWMPNEQVRKIYQLRWQIELRFKAWKSFYNLDAIKKMKRCRFECYLYATLLMIMINWEIAVNFFSILWKHGGKLLSLLKFYKTTSQYISTMRRAILEGKDNLQNYIQFLYEVSYDKLLTEKRKRYSASFEEILSVTL